MLDRYREEYGDAFDRGVGLLRILFIERPNVFGGSLTGLLEIIAHLDPTIQPVLFCYYPIDKIANIPARLQVCRLPVPLRNLAIPSPRLRGYAREIANLGVFLAALTRVQRQGRFDVIVGNNYLMMNSPYALVARLFGIPFVSMEKSFTTTLTRQAAYVTKHGLIWRHVAYPGPIRDALAKALGSEEKIELMYEPISDCYSKQERPRRSGGPVVIGTHSTLVEWKGQVNLIEAVARLKEMTDVPFCLHIACPPAPRGSRVLDEVKARVERFQLGDRVKLKGFFSDVRAHLAQVDLSCHVPDLPEPFGRVTAESMMAGLPVIVGNGGPGDYVARAGCGLVVEPNNPQMLAEALKRLIEDPGLRERFGKKGQDYALTHFRSQIVVPRFEQLLRKAAGKLEECP